MNKIMLLAMSLGLVLTACTHREPVTVVEPDATFRAANGEKTQLNEVKMHFSEANAKGEKTTVPSSKQ